MFVTDLHILMLAHGDIHQQSDQYLTPPHLKILPSSLPLLLHLLDSLEMRSLLDSFVISVRMTGK